MSPNLPSPWSGDPQTFAAQYSSPTGKPLKVAQVEIDGRAFALKPATAGSPVYQYTTSSLTTGFHYYRFRFSDGTATGIYEQPQTPVIVPFLVNGGIGVSPRPAARRPLSNPQVKTRTTTVGRQASVLAHVDGTPYPMTVKSGDPTSGQVRGASLQLAVGQHTYYFAFRDGTSLNAQPHAPSTLSGPTVSLTPERLGVWDSLTAYQGGHDRRSPGRPRRVAPAHVRTDGEARGSGA